MRTTLILFCIIREAIRDLPKAEFDATCWLIFDRRYVFRGHPRDAQIVATLVELTPSAAQRI